MKTYIKAGTLIDGTGRDIQKNKVLVIENGTITDIADSFTADDGDEVLDYSDKAVMPGMINAHVHIGDDPYGKKDSLSDVEWILFCLSNIDSLLQSGVTYIRNLGTENYADVKIRRAMDKGLTQKVGMVVSGPFITMTGGHGYMTGIEADGTDECRKAARTIIKNGADVVKIMATGGVITPGVEPGAAQLTMEEMAAAVAEAHRADKRTASHAQGTTGIKNAVMAGIDSIEHGIYLDDEVIQMMLDRGTYLVPTLLAPLVIVEGGDQAGLPDFIMRKARLVLDVHRESFRKALKAGVKIAMGTDAGTPLNRHDQSFRELELMVDNGMTAMEAIVAATKTGAELLKVDDKYGTLEKGKMADLIVLSENPVENIGTLEHVEHVMKEGKWVR
ncbi:amidohydrolase family protein [Clostridium sp. AM58-1XD]|uniref:metal-dependent hydrolase family protein n=1 Tax=Clostridium sp. AM58-1XD TaxID=2292307 RepID=UPI000E4A1B30|nr:amidohydrolase family protein [Clostridium sp. AM58-1XD]RGZ00986.1 amidohydrolase family protein [Clostridium sp. AM58-1XD]